MKPTTVTHLRQWKQEQRKFATLTAYDASFAKLFEEQGIKVLLVGDSLGMTLQGHDSTLPVTVADVASSISRTSVPVPPSTVPVSVTPLPIVNVSPPAPPSRLNVLADVTLNVSTSVPPVSVAKPLKSNV